MDDNQISLVNKLLNKELSKIHCCSLVIMRDCLKYITLILI